MNKYDFVCLYLPMALEAEQLFRISPVVILAQAAIESGWGESTLAKEHHNLFGITGYGPANDYWHGGTVELTKNSIRFRKYLTHRDSILDFARLIRSAYIQAAALSYHPATYAREIAYSKYISEVNGDNRDAYCKMLVSISSHLEYLIRSVHPQVTPHASQITADSLLVATYSNQTALHAALPT